MPGPDQTLGGGDTKLCPYCAETIKAAAIRCRYCQSDLPEVPTASPAEPSREPPPPESPSPPTLTGSSTSGRQGRIVDGLARVAVPVGATALALAVVLGLLAFKDHRTASERADAEAAGKAVRASISAKAEALLSYDAKTFDEDFDAAKDVMTRSFQKEYEPTVAEIRDKALQQERVQTADVVAVSVLQQSKDKVETLLFANTVSAQSGAKRQQIMQNRVKVTVVRSGDDWLIDDLDVPTS